MRPVGRGRIPSGPQGQSVMRGRAPATGGSVIACLLTAAVLGAATGFWLVFGVTLAALAAGGLGSGGRGRGGRRL